MKKKIVSFEEVKKIAKLCKLTLTEKEMEKLSKMLSETLDYINVLDELDVTNTSETFQVTGLTNVFQDGFSNTLSKEDALANAKEVIKGLFATEAVFDRK